MSNYQYFVIYWKKFPFGQCRYEKFNFNCIFTPGSGSSHKLVVVLERFSGDKCLMTQSEHICGGFYE